MTRRIIVRRSRRYRATVLAVFLALGVLGFMYAHPILAITAIAAITASWIYQAGRHR